MASQFAMRNINPSFTVSHYQVFQQHSQLLNVSWWQLASAVNSLLKNNRRTNQQVGGFEFCYMVLYRVSSGDFTEGRGVSVIQGRRLPFRSGVVMKNTNLSLNLCIFHQRCSEGFGRPTNTFVWYPPPSPLPLPQIFSIHQNLQNRFKLFVKFDYLKTKLNFQLDNFS